MFVILVLIIEGSIAFFWLYFMGPHIEADIESNIKALAQTQSSSIARVLSEENVDKDAVLKAIDSLFLLKDTTTDTPFVSGVELIVDYDAVNAPEGSLDITRWQRKYGGNATGDFYDVEIPLFSSRTKELLGLARFHGGKYSFQLFEKDVRKSFIIATLGFAVLLVAVWMVLLFLLRPLRLLSDSLSSGNIDEMAPIKKRYPFVSSEVRLVDKKLHELLTSINVYTRELETLNTILSTQQETSLDGIIILNSKGQVLKSNSQFKHMWEIPDAVIESGSGEQILNKMSERMCSPEVILKQAEYFVCNPEKKGFQEIELVDGSIFECYTSPMTEKDESYFGRVWYFRDITARREAEKSLWESEERYRLFLQNFVGIAYQTDKDTYEFTMLHGNVKEIAGYSVDEILSKNITLMDLVYPEDREKFLADIDNLKKGIELHADSSFRICMAGGDIRWVRYVCRLVGHGDDRPVFLQGAFYDITQRKNLETQLRQAQKMESIGTLAGGIAHDFNNILGIILGNAELTKITIPSENEVNEYIDEIRIACMRAKKMVEQILVFSRKNEQKFLPVSVNKVIHEACRLIRSTIPSTISISLDIPDNDERIIGDATQISQVMINLCANSAHAMREAGGILEITVTGFESGDSMYSHYYDLPEGRYIEIKVADNGHGINPGIKERIFDPYFTTKEVGEGSGMGLAVVHGIVSAHNGYIFVDSTPDKGTTIGMAFPAVDEKPEDEKESVDTLFRGSEKILISDDEKSITILLTKLFERLGYSVTAGTDPLEILSTFEKDPDGFDLLLTDMSMPKMTGYDLARKVKMLRPDMPVILCTGYSDIVDEKKALESGIAKFIMKPLALYNVAETVRKVLDSMNN